MLYSSLNSPVSSSKNSLPVVLPLEYLIRIRSPLLQYTTVPVTGGSPSPPMKIEIKSPNSILSASESDSICPMIGTGSFLMIKPSRPPVAKKFECGLPG